MFDRDSFIEDCINAGGAGPQAVGEVVARAVSDPSGIVAELGEPDQGGVEPIYSSGQLTIVNYIWPPNLSLLPHNHQMYAILGIYSGREENVLWKRSNSTIEASGSLSLGTGETANLGRDVIHSVFNPIAKLTCAIHVYGGDIFAPDEPRSEWDHETLEERPWNKDLLAGLMLEKNTHSMSG